AAASEGAAAVEVGASSRRRAVCAPALADAVHRGRAGGAAAAARRAGGVGAKCAARSVALRGAGEERLARAGALAAALPRHPLRRADRQLHDAVHGGLVGESAAVALGDGGGAVVEV